MTIDQATTEARKHRPPIKPKSRTGKRGYTLVNVLLITTAEHVFLWWLRRVFYLNIFLGLMIVVFGVLTGVNCFGLALMIVTDGSVSTKLTTLIVSISFIKWPYEHQSWIRYLFQRLKDMIG
ncbi:hypothetical protein FK216_12835 [Moraxellaceae bacterium AER2_44_116]|nr:hypothetical protein [Moraxellaceae bacterium]TQC96142.1 hypothetical protein FK216_12835 [Moraxellaceae bacterium AER2_44_116]